MRSFFVKFFYSSLLFTLLLPFNSFSQSFYQLDETFPESYASFDLTLSGVDVHVDGDYMIVTSPYASNSKGKVSVLFFDGSTWVKQATLTASDGASGDQFGFAASISDSTIVVSAWYSDQGGNDNGAAYVFKMPSGGWTDMTETGKLTPSDTEANDLFGYSVCVSENTIVIGSIWDDDAGGECGSAYVFEMPTAGWVNMTETAKLSASDAASDDYLGYSVGIFGDNILIGAVLDDHGVGQSGSAYVFEKPTTGWTTMTETAKLTASDAASDDQFARSLSISDSLIVVGAVQNDQSGSAYVFEMPTTGWVSATETAKLTTSDAATDDGIGFSVTISDSIIIFGAPRNDDGGSSSGSVYVYKQPVTGWVDTIQTAKLVASDAASGDTFGYSASISDSTIVVGAYGDDDGGSGSGSAYVFKQPVAGWADTIETQKLNYIAYNDDLEDIYFGGFPEATAVEGNYAVIGAVGTDTLQLGYARVMFFNGVTWDSVATLTASDAEADDEFGRSVNISDSIIVIGARYDDDLGDASGAAYVYQMPTTGWADMTETAKLLASDSVVNAQFGISVDVSGDVVIVGAHKTEDSASTNGAAYIYEKPVGGWVNMTETVKLTASDGASDDQFGISVAIFDSILVVGSNNYEDAISNQGAAYIFERSGGTWSETAILTASDAESNDKVGFAVSISDVTVLVGAHQEDEGGSNSGAAYVFEKSGGTWSEQGKLTASDPSASDQFGYSLSISDTTIAIGARNEDAIGSNNGSVYVYYKPSGGWVSSALEDQKIIANDAVSNDKFGTSVSVSGTNLVVGSLNEETGYDNTGSAYLFTFIKQPDTPTLSVSDAVICEGSNVFIAIAPSDQLNDALYWSLHEGTCDGPLLDTSSTGTFALTPTSTTTYYVTGAGNNAIESNCDSITITVLPAATSTDVQTTCGSYTWIDGVTYSASTSVPTFTYSGVTSSGCDSIVTLDLTILPPSTGIDVQTTCGSYTWIDGVTYSATTSVPTFTYSGVTSSGCDSIVTLDLTILAPSVGTDVQTACESYTWINGVNYSVTPTVAPSVILAGGASNGCDSIVTLDLTILGGSVYSIDLQDACNSYTWIDGVTYTQSNNTATYMYIGGASTGCDSIVTLDLTIDEIDLNILESNTVLFSSQGNATYQWLDCSNMSEIVGETGQSMTATSNGIYAVEITYNGCVDTSECIVVDQVGLEEASFEEQLIVYPNPNNGQFSIEFGKVYNDVRISIVDLKGRLVVEESFKNEQLVDMTIDAEPGVYIVNIDSGEHRAHVRIVKK